MAQLDRQGRQIILVQRVRVAQQDVKALLARLDNLETWVPKDIKGFQALRRILVQLGPPAYKVPRALQ
jgi:hypothetical protein